MKKALLTTTALVALSSSVAFADSIDTVVPSSGSTHHTHAKQTVTWSGNAYIALNAPLKANAGDNTDAKFMSDVDLDVLMESPGQYSAKVSVGIEGGALEKLGSNATISTFTPYFDLSVGTDDANGGAGAGADASDLYTDIDRMTNIGEDEDSSDWYISIPLGPFKVAASGERNLKNPAIAADDPATAAREDDASVLKNRTSIGLSGAIGNLKINAGGMDKSGGASVSTNLMGATVKVATSSIYRPSKSKNVQESGVEISIPLGTMTVTANSTTTDGTNNWGASVSAKLANFDVSVGTDSEEENTFSIKGPMGPVQLHIDYDSDDSSLTHAEDATVEAGITYNVPGTNGTTISASYSNDDDDFNPGTQVKMAFKF